MGFMKIFDLSAKLPTKDPFTKISMFPLDGNGKRTISRLFFFLETNLYNWY